MQFTDDPTRASLTEGVLDAAVLSDDEWLVVDWKTDSLDGDDWTKRRTQYEKQVTAYEQILKTLSDRPATSVIQRVKTDGVSAK